MALHIDPNIQEASPAKASSSTNSARQDVESRHPEIILDGSVDSLCSISDGDEDGTDIEDVEEEECELSFVYALDKADFNRRSVAFETYSRESTLVVFTWYTDGYERRRIDIISSYTSRSSGAKKTKNPNYDIR
jgi:hypothetical protein